jgi:gluconate 5-dehydrogenase
MADWLGLEGRRVLVAGAGTLGAAVATGFHDVGAAVIAIDLSASRLDALVSGTTMTGVEADLADAGSCRAAVGESLRRLGGIDVFVHCVGINKRVPVEQFEDGEWESIIGVNLSSAFHAARTVLRSMRAQGSGRVILFSSVAGLLGHRDHGPYAATNPNRFNRQDDTGSGACDSQR